MAAAGTGGAGGTARGGAAASPSARALKAGQSVFSHGRAGDDSADDVTGPVDTDEIIAPAPVYTEATIDAVVAAHTGHGVLLVAPPEDAMLMYPMAEIPEHLPEPRLIALSIGVTDRDRAADFLRLQGVDFERSPNGDVLLPPRETHGLALELVQA